MATLSEVVFAISFGKPDTKNLDKAKKASIEAADATAKKWKDAAKKIAKAFTVIGVAGIAAAAGVFKLVENVAIAGDEIAKTSKGLNIAADQLQRLRFAAERSGGSAKGMTRALRELTAGLNDAATKGTGPVADGLKAIGLRASDVQGLGIEDQFGVIADALLKVEDGSQRSAIAMQLFGKRGGAALAPLLEEGGPGIKALGDEAERLGLIMGGPALEASEKFADDLLDLKGVIGGLVRTMVGDLLPQISEWLALAKQWILANKDLINEKLRIWLDKLVSGLLDLAAAAKAMLSIGASLVSMFGGVENAAIATATAFGVVQAAALGLPGVIAAVSLAVGAALGSWIFGLEEIQDRIKKLQGQSRVFKKGTERIQKGREALKELKDLSDDGIAGLTQDQYEKKIEDVIRMGGKNNDLVVDFFDRRRDQGQRDRALRKPTLDVIDTNDRFLRSVTGGPKKKKKGGGKSDDGILIDTRDDEADALVGDDLRRLAAQHGVDAVGVDSALTAAASSLKGGSNAKVARQAALSRLGGLAGEDFSKVGKDRSFADVLMDSNVPDIGLSAIARGAEPQTLISTINNTFTFDNDFAVNGAGDPGAVGNQIALQLREAFQGSLAKSTKTANVKFAR